MYLLDRDKQILEALAYKVRLLSIEQIATTWWPDSKGYKAKEKLLQLRKRGFLVRSSVPAKPLLPLNGPVFTWTPGQAAPAAARLSQHFRHRWAKHHRNAAVITPVYVASRFTAFLFGGVGGRLNVQTATHDLHVASIYLHFLTTDPDAAHAWVGEDAKGKAGRKIKDPDAFIEQDRQEPLVVEFAGAYSNSQVESFHKHCVKHGLSYQLW